MGIMPFIRRPGQQLLFCLAGVGVGVAVLGVPVGLLTLTATLADRKPAGGPALALGYLAFLVALAVTAPRIGRAAGRLHRRLAARLLGEDVAEPAKSARTGWRAFGYLLLKVPLAVLEGYAALLWLAGLANMTYPFWWPMFRNHPPGVRLSPVGVLTPFGIFDVATFPGTFAAFGAGAAMVLVAPWATKGVTMLDAALIRGLLGPGRLAQRVQDLQQSRAHAVDEAAAALRQVERDLHDGAQIRLATLAMNLGLAKEKLATEDVDQAAELVDAAHRGAKDALAELRDLVRGIHPPVLDNGLADALASLAATSPVPVRLGTDLPVRPTPAIETIAYFCAAELIANAAKHSHASAVEVHASEEQGVLRLSVADDGVGGADPAAGSGLSGLAQRVSTVDGRLDVDSPPGGPTRITVHLPLRA
jgi:signal transduction histidine kinase